MHILRRFAFTGLVLGLGFAALSDTTRGQAPAKKQAGVQKEGYVSGEARARVNEMRDGKRPFTNANDLPGYRNDLKQMAEHLVFRVTQDEYYHPPTTTKAGELRPPALDVTIQAV